MINKLTKLKNNNSGFVILFAMVVSGILLAVGLGVANVAYKEISFSSSAKASNDSFFAADAGVECVLYNDKSGVNAFYYDENQPNHDVIISCLNTAITAVFDDSALSPTWEFIVPPPEGYNYCAKVTVSKDINDYYTTTDVVSKGYNLGGSSCDSNSSSLVERELQVTYNTGVIVANDDFTQGTEVPLEDHDPAGLNAGYEWLVQVVDENSGTITNMTNGTITDSVAGKTSRYKMNTNLGSSRMSVEADFTFNGTPGAKFGLLGRLPLATGSGAFKGIIGIYDRNNNMWQVTDELTTSREFVEVWPYGTDPVNMRLEVEYGVARLYANDVLKVTWNFNPQTLYDDNNYAGIIFSNVTPGQVTADNYKSRGY
jgi:hypothetical protein